MQFVGLEERMRRVRCIQRREGLEDLRTQGSWIMRGVDEERATA